jgi:hypothetical protein
MDIDNIRSGLSAFTLLLRLISRKRRYRSICQQAYYETQKGEEPPTLLAAQAAKHAFISGTLLKEYKRLR